ncbi:hypothetical protein FHW94_004004 [Novosphingobium sp. SG720]|nr:hypothetical protein [Novosphingobium sp. SG720]
MNAARLVDMIARNGANAASATAHVRSTSPGDALEKRGDSGACDAGFSAKIRFRCQATMSVQSVICPALPSAHSLVQERFDIHVVAVIQANFALYVISFRFFLLARSTGICDLIIWEELKSAN